MITFQGGCVERLPRACIINAFRPRHHANLLLAVTFLRDVVSESPMFNGFLLASLEVFVLLCEVYVQGFCLLALCHTTSVERLKSTRELLTGGQVVDCVVEELLLSRWHRVKHLYIARVFLQ